MSLLHDINNELRDITDNKTPSLIKEFVVRQITGVDITDKNYIQQYSAWGKPFLRKYDYSFTPEKKLKCNDNDVRYKIKDIS